MLPDQKRRMCVSRIACIPLIMLWTLFCFNMGHLSGLQRICWQHEDEEENRTAVPSQRWKDRVSLTAAATPTTRGGVDSATTTNSNKKNIDAEDHTTTSTARRHAVRELLPMGVSDFAASITRLPRDEFLDAFDIGVPFAPSFSTNHEVLLFHSKLALPPPGTSNAQTADTSTTTIPLMNVTEATSNCNQMHVILTDHRDKGRRQCVALVGHYESFHIQKFLRPILADGSPNPGKPLMPRGRGVTLTGDVAITVPTNQDRVRYWYFLEKYMSNLEKTLDQLRPIAEKAAVNKTIVVMVCNFGQSELLLNFICSLQRRQIDLSSAALLVFATDKKTYDLVSAMGVPVFYDEINYGKMPEDAALDYMDDTYTVLMLAKVFCVHMVNALGCNVLFQDVDMIWYRNPLEYFTREKLSQADIFFQEDGNSQLVYTPYSANTGFYLVKNNDRTRHFLHSLLMSGEWILTSRSHQRVVSAILAEHASLFNLRVKVFSKHGGLFPGGFAFRRDMTYMRDLIQGKVDPYIFHMSWTDSKVDKLKFFQQMGEWYLEQDACIQKTREEILHDTTGTVNHNAPLVSHCCMPEPKVVCHYRNAPSKIPCRDSPPTDKNRKSFW